MSFGVTSTGFSRKTFTDLSTALQTKVRAAPGCGAVQFTARTLFGNLVAIVSDALAQVWELAETVYHGTDPDACETEEQFEALCKLSSVTRRGAQRGTVYCTINVDAGFSAAAGDLVASPVDRPAELWRNRSAIVSVAGGTLTNRLFESVVEGFTPFVAAGTLTVISASFDGWNSVTNPLDAVAGRNIEPIDELRARREASLAIQGGSTLAGIVADLIADDTDGNPEVAGIVAADGRENVTGVFADIPPHTFEIVVWDGDPAAASDNEIAQTIWDSKPAGILAVGSDSGAAIDFAGDTQTVAFSRATDISVYIRAAVTGTFDSDDAKEALVALYPPTFRQSIVVERLSAELFTVDGVTDVVSLEVSTDGSTWGTANLVPLFGQIYLLDTSRITFT